MAQTMDKGPTTANERYVILDALRGLALLGIALAIRCFCNRRADVDTLCVECDARASVGTDRPLAALCRKRRSDGGGICDGDVSVVSQKAVRKTFHLSLITFHFFGGTWTYSPKQLYLAVARGCATVLWPRIRPWLFLWTGVCRTDGICGVPVANHYL